MADDARYRAVVPSLGGERDAVQQHGRDGLDGFAGPAGVRRAVPVGYAGDGAEDDRRGQLGIDRPGRAVLDGRLDRAGKPGGQAAALGGEVLAERLGDLAEVTVDDPQ